MHTGYISTSRASARAYICPAARSTLIAPSIAALTIYVLRSSSMDAYIEAPGDVEVSLYGKNLSCRLKYPAKSHRSTSPIGAGYGTAEKRPVVRRMPSYPAAVTEQV